MRYIGWIGVGVTVLSGCVSAPVGIATAAGMMGVNAVASATAGMGEGDVSHIRGKITVDPGTLWHRTFSGLGRSASGSDKGGEVRWTVPFGVERGVRAVLVLTDPACEASYGQPGAVQLKEDKVIKSDAEVWILGNTGGATGRGLGPQAEARLTQAAGIPVAVSTRWLVLTPNPGGYVLAMDYGPYTAPEKILRVRPCIVAWKAVDGDSAMAVTLPGSRDSAGTSFDHNIGDHISDSTREGAVRGNSDNPDPSSAIDDLGLLGDVAYDLTLLNDQALAYELGQVELSGRHRSALLAARGERLKELEDGQHSLLWCSLSGKLGGGGRKFTLWGEQPTVPPPPRKAGCP